MVVPAPVQHQAVASFRTQNTDGPQRQFRAQLLAQLNSALVTRDTPRGLVVTVTDSMFESGNDTLRSDAGQRLGSMAAVLSSYRGLYVRVEGYGDMRALSEERAQAVRAALMNPTRSLRAD